MAKTVDTKTQQGGKMNKGVRILGCKCASEFQDELYGNGNRVCNGRKDGFICVVCGTIKKGE